MGIAFRRELYLSTRQVYPPLQDRERGIHTRTQAKLLRKLGDNAYPFFFEVRRERWLERELCLKDEVKLSVFRGKNGWFMDTVASQFIAQIKYRSSSKLQNTGGHCGCIYYWGEVKHACVCTKSTMYVKVDFLTYWLIDIVFLSSQFPDNLPCSVALQPAPHDVGKVRSWLGESNGCWWTHTHHRMVTTLPSSSAAMCRGVWDQSVQRREPGR